MTEQTDTRPDFPAVARALRESYGWAGAYDEGTGGNVVCIIVPDPPRGVNYVVGTGGGVWGLGIEMCEGPWLDIYMESDTDESAPVAEAAAAVASLIDAARAL